jgi:CubicO group peptidase (beta-lactamase class C family)
MKLFAFSFLFIKLSSAACFNTNISDLNNREFVLKSSIDTLIASTSIEKSSLLIGNSKGILFKTYRGHSDNDLKFDIASLTKLFTATTLINILDESNDSIHSKLSELLPNSASSTQKDKLTIEDLLRHRSGYKAGVRLDELADNTIDSWSNIRNLIPSRKYGKFIYSDINYLLLGEVIRELTAQRLSDAFDKYTLDPLGLSKTCFASKECLGDTREEVAATSSVNDGVVHDPTSRHVEGVAGNAGLFSTIDDIAKFSSVFLNNGRFCKRQIIQKSSVDLMTIKQENSPRGLGFDLTSGYSTRPRGDYFNKGKSFGHTGYTGTSVWIDPEVDIFVVFLTNAVKSKKAKKDFLRVNKELATLIGKYFYSLIE